MSECQSRVVALQSRHIRIRLQVPLGIEAPGVHPVSFARTEASHEHELTRCGRPARRTDLGLAELRDGRTPGDQSRVDLVIRLGETAARRSEDAVVEQFDVPRAIADFSAEGQRYNRVEVFKRYRQRAVSADDRWPRVGPHLARLIDRINVV